MSGDMKGYPVTWQRVLNELICHSPKPLTNREIAQNLAGPAGKGKGIEYLVLDVSMLTAIMRKSGAITALRPIRKTSSGVPIYYILAPGIADELPTAVRG